MRARALAVPVLVLAAAAGGCQPAMQDFSSPEYKFKVKFPGKPEQKTQPGPMGTTANLFTVSQKNGMLGVAVTDMPLPDDMPQAAIDSALDGSVNGSVRGGGGTLTSSSKITLASKYPGREFTGAITNPKQGQIRSKIYLVGKRLYQVMVVGTDSYATSKNADEFLSSFQLTE